VFEINYAERYVWPEAGETVELTFSNGMKEKMKFNRIKPTDSAKPEYFAEVITQGRVVVETYIQLQSFIQLAHLPEIDLDTGKDS